MLGDAIWLLTVAILWGFTNPLLKRYSTGVDSIKRHGRISQFLAEFRFLFFNWKYLLSFITNQMGSVLYYVTLSSADLTLAVPITNSLTLIATAFSSQILGDKNMNLRTLLGASLVICGVILCVFSKSETGS
ncbi:transmembrane protein 234 [Biomphalaria glabrata]|uniref:Transmembrane protein 234 homolog n=1 Tax=Biomphalaria glabrata TaxID=6526 RepID=A0A9U8E948_BIOGL|nr:transmembrane protein 234 homolog [Biomphalaria glabrata]